MSIERSQIETIFDSYYNDKIQNKKLLNKIKNFSESFVPYIKGKTNLLAFNFFKYNYNLRDPILLSIYLGSNPKNKILRVFKPNESIYLDSKFLSKLNKENIKYDNLIIRVSHPYLKSANNEYRFFGVYFDKSKFISVTHSQKKPDSYSVKCGTRSFGVKKYDYLYFDSKNYHDLRFEKKSFFLNNNKKKLIPGFICQKYKQYITGIWHDTDYSNKAIFNKKTNFTTNISQVLIWPKPNKINISIFIDNNQIGFIPDEVFIEVISLKNNKKIKKIKFKNITNHDFLEIKNIKYREDCYLKVFLRKKNYSIAKPSLGYLQAIYKAKDIAIDEVHSMITPSYNTDKTKPNVSFRCRKFAPLVFNKKLKSNFYIINLDNHGSFCDERVRVRVFGENNEEMIEDIIFRKNTGVHKINTNNIKKFLVKNKLKSGILMIEAEKTNYSAIFTLSNNYSFGIDHFTGG